jgi:hypothetical protein
MICFILNFNDWRWFEYWKINSVVRIGPGPPLQYRLASKSRPRHAHCSNRTAATKHCRHPGFGRHLTCTPPLPYPLVATTKGGRKSFFFFHEAVVLCALLSPLLPLLPCCPSTCHHAGRALPSPSSKSHHQPGVLLRNSSCCEELCRSVSANRSDSDVLQANLHCDDLHRAPEQVTYPSNHTGNLPSDSLMLFPASRAGPPWGTLPRWAPLPVSLQASPPPPGANLATAAAQLFADRRRNLAAIVALRQGSIPFPWFLPVGQKAKWAVLHSRPSPSAQCHFIFFTFELIQFKFKSSLNFGNS